MQIFFIIIKNTKEKKIYRIFKSSKFVKDKYKEDLESVVTKYKEKGYRDARILHDSITYDKKKNTLAIKVDVEDNVMYFCIILIYYICTF